MGGRKGKKARYFLTLLRLAVVTGGILWGIWWLAQGQRWQNLRTVLARTNPLILASVLIVFAAAQAIVALRWWLLLRTQSVYIPYLAGLRLHFLGLFYNNFMPSSVGGDLIRAWYVTRYTDRKFQAALSVFVDRLVGFSSTLLIAAFFYLIFLQGRLNLAFTPGKSRILAALTAHRRLLLLIAAVVVVSLLLTFVSRRGRRLLAALSALVRERIIRRFAEAAIIYCRNPLTILAALALTVFLQLMTITSFWFLGGNLGIQVRLTYYYVFFTLTWVLGAVPVSIGGAVVVESLLAFLFVRFADVEPEAALALALCQRFVWMLASLPGAAIHLIGTHLPKDLSADYRHSNSLQSR